MIYKTKYFDPSRRDVGPFILYITLMINLIAAMKIDPDGGYKDLVIRISSDGSVPENDCPKILYNLKVRMTFVANSYRYLPTTYIRYIKTLISCIF